MASMRLRTSSSDGGFDPAPVSAIFFPKPSGGT
jgi:hypothetical protein